MFEPDMPLVHHVIPSPNIEARRAGFGVDLLIIHYTGMPSAAEAIAWLASPESGVSCHYVVDEAGTITQMVPECLRAWHAGASHWRGVDDVNSCSIGIEVQNVGHDAGYPDFPEAQIEAVQSLALDIIRRHGIKPHRVLAHSDVAPRRKIDPGEKFPWQRLASAGIGHWVGSDAAIMGATAPLPGDRLDVSQIQRRALDRLIEVSTGNSVMRLQRQLRAYGYWIEATGVFDDHTRMVVKAFQRHFRPERVDGIADAETVETLDALLASLPANV